jgi:hypothetical protein
MGVANRLQELAGAGIGRDIDRVEYVHGVEWLRKWNRRGFVTDLSRYSATGKYHVGIG